MWEKEPERKTGKEIWCFITVEQSVPVPVPNQANTQSTQVQIT